jgi:hypothetical protein
VTCLLSNGRGIQNLFVSLDIEKSSNQPFTKAFTSLNLVADSIKFGLFLKKSFKFCSYFFSLKNRFISFIISGFVR